MAHGLMYYRLVRPGGEEVDAKINPTTLPRTTPGAPALERDARCVS
jgi:hypothetical protein